MADEQRGDSTAQGRRATVRGSHRPPHWWPEGAEWPPRRRPRPLGILVRLLIGLAVITGIGMVVTAFAFHSGGPPWAGTPSGPSGGWVLWGPLRGLVFVVLAVVLVGTIAGARGARRLNEPLGELVEAARGIEQGDYRVRVTERAWGPLSLRALVHAMNTAAARLQTDDEQRRRLLANTSHELRTPLTVLQGELEAMLDGVHPADEEHLTLALEQTQLIGRLIEDLRTLALADAGTLTLHREAVDLGEIARDSAAAFTAIAERAGVRIAVEAPRAVVIDGDPVRLRQVIDNLLANAVRYAPRGTAVRVAVTSLDGTARLVVADAGPGMSAELLAHVFDRFQKSDESRGSGLGLAIVRELVQAHGGTVHAENAAEGGARFEVTLPAG